MTIRLSALWRWDGEIDRGHYALIGSGSRLSTTWYQHHMWPAEYWQWWSDAIIHRIHLRVLTHIIRLAEEDGRNAPRR